MLEDELTSILADDDDVKQLVIVDNTEQQELARKLRSQNRPFLIKDFEGPLISLRSIDRGAFWRTFDKKTWRSSADASPSKRR